MSGIINKADTIINGVNSLGKGTTAPSKGNLSRLINPEDISYEFGAEYSQDSFFPSTLAELQNPYILRNLRGQAVDFHPIQYNPIQKVLRVYSKITVKVSSTGDGMRGVDFKYRLNNLLPGLAHCPHEFLHFSRRII